MRKFRPTATDLANLAFTSPANKRAWVVRNIEPKVIPYTYDPFRRSVGDAVNLQLPLFSDGAPPTPWACLEAVVKRECGGNERAIAVNLPVAKAVHTFALTNSLQASPMLDVGPLSLYPGWTHTFWMPLIHAYDGGISAAFADPRRSHGLTESGRRFVASAMKERLSIFPEYNHLRYEAWRFGERGPRQVRVYRIDPASFYTYEELVADVAETYAIIQEVIERKEAEGRRAAGGTKGTLI